MDSDQYSGMHQTGSLIGALFGGLIWLAFVVIILASLWKVFVKMGKPGWAGIVPIYNVIVILEEIGKPVWWIILLFIPCVGFVFGIIILIAFAERFGKGPLFGIGLALLGFIFFPILAFGDAKYRGPAPRLQA